jgi:hypothetical protein
MVRERERNINSFLANEIKGNGKKGKEIKKETKRNLEENKGLRKNVDGNLNSRVVASV